MEERILTSLVQLKELDSSGEILLQVESLHAISQGGYYYPELQDHYASILQALGHSSPDSQKAHALLSQLEEKTTH